MKSTHPLVKYAAIIVWLHLLIVIVHGLAHVLNHVNQSALTYAFIIVVIIVAPLVALLLLSTGSSTGWQRPGAALLALSMLGSLLFGLVNHFILPGSDSVAQALPGIWQSVFLITAILLAISEATGTAIGLWCFFALAQPHESHTKSENFEGE